MTQDELNTVTQEVIAELKKNGTNIADASVVSDISQVNNLVAYGKNGKVIKVTPRTIQESVVKHVAWNDSSRLNNFTTAGVYNIKGERTMSPSYDNLPIYNSGGGHTISARLEVLDSSINDTTNSDDKCITQKLTLSNRVGGDGNVYIRTGRGRTYDSIIWEKWATLQPNINVGEVRSLDNFVDNGIYSGIWTDNFSSFAETFVMITINDYAVAGDDKTITQFKYAYDTLAGSGTPTFTTRSLFNGEWSNWTSIKGGGGSGGGDYTLPIATADVLGGVKIKEDSFNSSGLRIENDGQLSLYQGGVKLIPGIYDINGVELRKVKDGGIYTGLINRGDEERPFILVVSHNLSNPSLNPFILQQLTYVNEDGNIVMLNRMMEGEENSLSHAIEWQSVGGGGSGGGGITATPTEEVINGIEPTLVTDALRKTPQVLTDSEKEIARGNIGAVSHSDLNNAIVEAITNVLNTEV